MDLTNYYLNLLPCYGNPQRVEHIVEPPVRIGGWIRGGEPTRDIVRKINYNKHIPKLKNNQLLHKINKIRLIYFILSYNNIT